MADKNTSVYVPYWENKRDGVTIAHGPKETLPSTAEQRRFREAGYQIFIEGKLKA